MVYFKIKKIPFWVYFEGPWNGKCCIFTAIWYNLWPFGKLMYGHLVYNLWPFGIDCGHLNNFQVLVCLDQEKSGNPALRAAAAAFCEISFS
jgi:hypothetical protein